jgi:hypothetical protein
LGDVAISQVITLDREVAARIVSEAQAGREFEVIGRRRCSPRGRAGINDKALAVRGALKSKASFLRTTF